MRRDQMPPDPNGTFVLRRWKIVYVSVPTAASTSLKWLMADLAGEDPAKAGTWLRPEVTRAAAIHNRDAWLHTPRLHDLNDGELAEIDATWFVFAVVRHPTSRLWSAWQSKFLLREPRFMESHPFFRPPVPRRTADVIDAFGSFVDALAESGSSLLENRHFRAQTEITTPDKTPYTRIYKTDEISDIVADLHRHVEAQGLDAMPPVRRGNGTPLPLLRSVLDSQMVDAIEKLYGADLQRFSFDHAIPESASWEEAYSPALLAEVARLVQRSERIDDVCLAARELQDENDLLQELLRLRSGASDHRPRNAEGVVATDMEQPPVAQALDAGKAALARKDWGAARRLLAPHVARAPSGLASFLLAQAEFQAGRTHIAALLLHAFQVRHSEHVDAQVLGARIRLAQGDRAAARAETDAALDLKPDHVGALRLLSEISVADRAAGSPSSK
jgi:uncharacterized protein HemY